MIVVCYSLSCMTKYFPLPCDTSSSLLARLFIPPPPASHVAVGCKGATCPGANTALYPTFHSITRAPSSAQCFIPETSSIWPLLRRPPPPPHPLPRTLCHEFLIVLPFDRSDNHVGVRSFSVFTFSNKLQRNDPMHALAVGRQHVAVLRVLSHVGNEALAFVMLSPEHSK